MALRTKWESGLVAVGGTQWHVAILVDTLTSPTVGEVWLDGEQPLTVEWPSREVTDALHGSAVTLRVISPSDRALTDLYTVAHGRVMLEIRDAAGELWWTGALDPEFYEEPYESRDGYTVELTFSDLGCLDRYEWDGTALGTVSVGAVLTRCLSLMGLGALPVNTSMVSTTTVDKGSVLDGVFVTGANFIDEEGEAMKMDEVLEAVLQPLGLHVTQKAGKIWVFDLNGLSQSSPRGVVEWSGDSQTLGVAPVASRVKITFSPYADAAVMDTDIDYDDVPAGSMPPVVIYMDQRNNGGVPSEPDNIGFYITPCGSGTLKNVSLHGGTLQWVKIHGIFSGDDDAAIAWGFRSDLKNTMPDSGNLAYNGSVWHVTKKRWPFIPAAWVWQSDFDEKHFHRSFDTSMWSHYVRAEGGLVEKRVEGSEMAYMKLTVETLIDPRYNPFESGGDDNCKNRLDFVQAHANMVYIPAMVRVVDPESGSVLAHWENWADIKSESMPSDLLARPVRVCGKWVTGDGAWGCMMLAYYDWEDRDEKSGITGWQSNKPAIALTNKPVPKSLRNRGVGEYLPLPPVAGKVVVDVCPCLWMREIEDYVFPARNITDFKTYEIFDHLRWFLLKTPKIEMTDNNGQEQDNDDVEYVGELIAEAKDEVSLDTVCGTMERVPAGARGVFRDAAGVPLQELVRQREIDRPERLLINTVYSQMGSRHTTLSGEAAFDPDGVGVYTERNQGAKRFMVSGETADLRMMTSDVELLEVTADEYAPEIVG